MIVIIGSIAAIVSIAAFLPQAWRIVKTRRTEDLSTPMWTLQVIAFACWICYGAFIAAWPIVVENSVCVILAGFILMMSLLPKRLRHAVADQIDPSVSAR